MDAAAAPPAATATGPRARQLPAEEWAEKLAGTELVQHLFDEEGALRVAPEYVMVFVVEEDGQVVACWAALTCVHLEGLWMLPDGYGGAGRARALLAATAEALLAQRITEALTTVADPDIAAMVERVGGRLLPGAQYVIPVGSVE